MPAGDAIETTDYSDYRAVSGTMQPFEMKLSSGGEGLRDHAGRHRRQSPDR
ncbi:MAG: hypothetical protein IPP63_18705 [Chloracidobacterium sp.]|nr:hypothetical protein [Chloracidobacterium sp.]